MPFKKAFGASSTGGRYGHSWTEDQRNNADTFRSYRPDEGSLSFCSEQERFKTTATAGLRGGSGGGTERTHAEKSMGRVARWGLNIDMRMSPLNLNLNPNWKEMEK